MSTRLWARALLQRLLLFLVAALVVVALVHVPLGVRPGGSKAPPSFSGDIWWRATSGYLQQLAAGDLGQLQKMPVQGYGQEQPVARLLADQGPRSAALLVTALALAVAGGTLLGFLASRFSWRLLRSTILSGTLVLLSIPDILMVILLRWVILWGMNQFGVQLFSGGVFGALEPQDLIAPVLTLVALPMALVARVAAVAFDEVEGQLYIRTARSKGLSPGSILWRHVLKNVWLQVADSAPLIVGSLVTGLVVVEYAYYFPGLGRTLGVMLEVGGQPGPTAAIALVLLAGALLTDGLIGLARQALDPRRSAEEPPAPAPGGLRHRFSLAELREGILGWARELPYAVGQALWRLRPGHFVRMVLRNPILALGLAGVFGLLFLAIYGSKLVDLTQANLVPRYVKVGEEVFFPPFRPGVEGYPLGSDMVGRNMLSRLLLGARYTLFFAFAVTPVRFLLALPWGLAAGFRQGFWASTSRAANLVFTALPVMVIPAALLPLQPVFTQGDPNRFAFGLITLVLAAVGVPRLAESIRQQVESTLLQPFVEGARAAGASPNRILRRHVLPHLWPQLWVAAAADMAWTLLLVVQLGVFSIFLGGAVRAQQWGREVLLPRMADWSAMLAKPYDVIYRAPWALWVPALAFLLAVVIFNLTAEGLRREAQRMAGGAPLPEPERLPDGTERIPAGAKRRLAMEWVAATVVVVLALQQGITHARTAPVQPPPRAVNTYRSTQAGLSAMLGRIAGTEDQQTRRDMVRYLDEYVEPFLKASFTEGMTAGEVQDETVGRMQVFDLESTRVIQYQVPLDILERNDLHSLVWFQNLIDGDLSHRQFYVKPVYLALKKDHLIMAGTVPGPDHWEVIFLRRSGSAEWLDSPDLAAAAAAGIPAEVGAELVKNGAGEPTHRIMMTGGSRASIQVDKEGALTFCQPNPGPCATIPYAEYAR